jgi:hypothetical protein
LPLVMLAFVQACAAATEAGAGRPPALHVQVSGTMHLAEQRSALLANPADDRMVSLGGFELTAWPQRRGLGASARVLQSTGTAPDLGQMEAGLLIGGPTLVAEGTYVRRTGYSSRTGVLHDSTHTFVRAGVRWNTPLGNTPFAIAFRAGYYIGSGETNPVESLKGWDGETSVRIGIRGSGVSALLGYRMERFYVSGVEQEVSALLLGTTYTFGTVR